MPGEVLPKLRPGGLVSPNMSERQADPKFMKPSTNPDLETPSSAPGRRDRRKPEEAVAFDDEDEGERG
jgi:hypothetical protein